MMMTQGGKSSLTPQRLRIAEWLEW